VSMGR